jgi:hypothetical protein
LFARYPRPFLVPAGVLGFRLLLEGLAFGLDGGCPLGVLALGRLKRNLRLVDDLLLALALPPRGRLFLDAFPLATLLFAFVGECCLPLRRGIDRPAGPLRGLSCRCFTAVPDGLPPRPSSVGKSGCSLNRPLDPTALFRTTPGLAMVAAITSGPSLCFAAFW